MPLPETNPIDDGTLSEQGKLKAEQLREMWATIKACWVDPDIRRMMCAEHLRYQAEVKAGRVQ